VVRFWWHSHQKRTTNAERRTLDRSRRKPRFTVTPPGHTLLMERQLVLLEQEDPFRLDDRTKEIGRRNVARAREALRRARSEANQQGRPAA